MAENYMIEEYSFNTENEYKKGLADYKKVQVLKNNLDFNKKNDLSKILKLVDSNKLVFESIIGKDFILLIRQAYKQKIDDDNIEQNILNLLDLVDQEQEAANEPEIATEQSVHIVASSDIKQIECPSCRGLVPETATLCSHCYFKIKEYYNRKNQLEELQKNNKITEQKKIKEQETVDDSYLVQKAREKREADARTSKEIHSHQTKILICPDCGGRLGNNDSKCPKCGLDRFFVNGYSNDNDDYLQRKAIEQRQMNYNKIQYSTGWSLGTYIIVYIILFLGTVIGGYALHSMNIALYR